jgi:hypothetical protein
LEASAVDRKTPQAVVATAAPRNWLLGRSDLPPAVFGCVNWPSFSSFEIVV